MSCDPPKIEYVWTAGDELPEIAFVLPDSLAVADFTITLRVDRPDGTVEAITATDLGGSAGKFVWEPTSLIAGDNQRCQFQMVNASTQAQTVPVKGKDSFFLIDVDEAIA